MNRRQWQARLVAMLAGTATRPALSQQKNSGRDFPSAWASLERAAAGRLGVAVIDGADGHVEGHRADERFPMCSTFKWMAAAQVLSRVDRGVERLSRRVRFGRDALLPNSPVCAAYAGGRGLSLGELCEATITVSDNTAANLILATYGGPPALTAYARTLGDTMTRLDRWEPQMSTSTPGDPRDTTSPHAMAIALRTALLGDVLSPASRTQLRDWLLATRTNGSRLRADLPAGWRMGSKTGTGDHGTVNDVGIFWPPAGAPFVVAVYLTGSTVPEAARHGTIAQVARQLTSAR